MKTWEYKINSVNEYDAFENVGGSVAERILDGASKDGWELVSVVGINTMVIFYFKRELNNGGAVAG